MKSGSQASESMTKVAPIVRWAGSKRRLLPKLAEYWIPGLHLRYLEPFAGSGALFFHLQPKNALLNDINGELISAYQQLAKDPKGIHRLVNAIPVDSASYYEVRGANLSVLNDVERAARFIYLNRNCFNGIYRTNQKGEFNVPYGAAKAGGIPSLEKFQAVANLLTATKLSSLDFEYFIKKNVKRGDFVYIDPPYAVDNRRVFRQYDRNTFGTEDVERLTLLLDLIDKRNAHFVVSYAYSTEIVQLMKRWRSRRVVAQRNIAGFAHHRRKAVEVMITNIPER